MSLENLRRIGQIKEHPEDRAEWQRLLDAAERNLQDAHVTLISPETRFDAAYKAIMQAALVSLMARGYRPDTKRPGHHATLIQTLPLTIGMPAARMATLDALRRQRNVADYTGDYVDDSSVDDCIGEAESLLAEVRAWLATHVR